MILRLILRQNISVVSEIFRHFLSLKMYFVQEIIYKKNVNSSRVNQKA